MINNYTIKHLSDFSFCKDMFEKFQKNLSHMSTLRKKKKQTVLKSSTLNIC